MWSHGFRESEVEHLDGAVRSQRDVCGLQIPMDDSLLVGSFESFRNLLCDLERLLNRHRSTSDPFVQALAVDELQHEELCAVRFL